MKLPLVFRNNSFYLFFHQMKNVGRNLFIIYFWQKICYYQFHRDMIKDGKADNLCITQQTSNCWNSIIETLQRESGNILNVNNKDTRIFQLQLCLSMSDFRIFSSNHSENFFRMFRLLLSLQDSWNQKLQEFI